MPARASILGGGLAVGTATAIRLALSFVMAVLIARLLGVHVKGELALIQQVPAIAALLMSFGFEGAHAYFVGRHHHDAGNAVADSLLLGLVAASIGIPIAALVMRQWIPALDSTPLPTLLLAASTVPLLVISNLLAGILTGQGRVPRHAFSQALSALVTCAVVIALMLLGMLNLSTILVATVIGLAVGIAISMNATQVDRIPRPSLARLRREFTYARRSYVQSVTGYLEVRQDVLLLGMLSTASGVGVYTIGVSLAELLFYAPQTLTAALTARALQEGASAGAELTATVTRLLTVFLVASTIALAAVIRPLVELLFGPPFSQAAYVFWLLAPGIIVWGTASQPTAYLATHGRLFPRVSTAALLVNLVLNIALIPRYGFYGAALATTVSYTLSSAYILNAFLRITGLRLADIVIMRSADVRLAVSAARALRIRITKH